ncbi:MAG: CHAT domain-containing tetratricopeptide repeat protein [Cyanobacteria bacterium P01_G01_bin.54]
MLQIWADQMLPQLNQDQQRIVAIDFFNFSTLIQQFPLNRSDTIEIALVGHSIAKQVLTQEQFPKQWATTQHNLAIAYYDRIEGERAQNLEDAISAYKLALQVRTQEQFPEDWAMTQNNLANAYSNRIRGERAQNLEDAISTYKLVLQMRTREQFPRKWAITQHNLANAYSLRIRGERAQNLEDAISAYKLALQVRTRKQFPEDWAVTQNNLANAYTNRVRGEQTQNLEEAIAAYKLALQVYTREQFAEQWAGTQNNLAGAYSKLIRGERAQNLEDAISAYKLALQVRTREQFPEDWAVTQNNLATAYYERIQGERAQNLEDALSASQLALQVYNREQFPEDWAMTQTILAIVYAARICGEQAQNLEEAILGYKHALEIYQPTTFPKECRPTSNALATLYTDNHRYPDSLHPYQLALTAAENLYQASISRFGQEAELKETNDLYRRAAYAHAKTNDLKRAIEILEQGRARGLSETLQRDRANLDQIQQQNPELFERYQTAANTLRNLEAIERSSQLTTENWSKSNADQASQTRDELKDCIAEIRQIPGYEAFLTLPTFADIVKSLQANRPLIYLTTTPSGSLALILTPTDAEPTLKAIWLDDLNEPNLVELLNQQWLPASRNMSQDLPTWLNVIDTITRQLWDQVMKLIVEYLEARHITQATLIPTGYLSLLPLHAAWTEEPSNTKTGRRYACDNICFTYAPNARSLQTAQAIAENTSVSNLLAVGNPTKDPGIHNFETSVTQVAAAAFPPGQAQVLRQDDANHENVLQAMPYHSVLQFYCHGYANFNEPLNSGLAMADQVLSLRDLFNLKLNGIRLAVLMACETGIPGTELPDEVVSLSTGLLQAGVAGVAASLWSVNAFSTMLMTLRFYGFWRKDGLEPAEALRQAQLWLRDTTSLEKAIFFNDTHPELKNSYPDLVEQLSIHLDPDYFAHPFHWAAFTYTGV